MINYNNNSDTNTFSLILTYYYYNILIVCTYIVMVEANTKSERLCNVIGLQLGGGKARLREISMLEYQE